MEAIILAGGFGTRLKDVVSDVPKPMAPINGRPFLEILLTKLAKSKFTRVILAVGYLSETIIDNFGTDYLGMVIEYVVEDDPLGTGGAVRLAMSKVAEDHVYIFNGDTYLDLEVDEVEVLWTITRNQIMVVRRVEDTARYGRVLHEDNFISGFVEKGEAGPGLINAGCYVLRSDALEEFDVGDNFSLEMDYFQKSVKYIKLRLFETEGHFIDIGVPEDFARAQIELDVF